VLPDLKDKVAASLTRYNMLSPGDKLGVAVSGGADSVMLLHILHTLAAYRLVVLHVNHELRGAESDGDERFVRELADKLGLPVEVRHAPVGEGNLEQLARDARRTFFAEARLNLGLRCLALGHTRTDQAETVLYRFLRGSGLAGLAGMSAVTADGLIRPMLDVTREEVRESAAQQGIAWREDSSNQNTDLVRNRLRLEVMNPQLVRVLAANASVAHDEEDWWASRIAHLFSATVQPTHLGLQFPVAALKALHPAEQRRLLRYAVRELKGDLKSIDLAHIEAIRRLYLSAKGTSRAAEGSPKPIAASGPGVPVLRELSKSEAGHDRILIPGVDALRSFGTLLLAEPGKLGDAPRHYREKIKIGTELAIPYNGGSLYVNRMKPEHQFCGNFGMEAAADIDEEVLERVGTLDSLYVRNWEPGDEYRRRGHGTSEKIKSLFQAYRILLWDRRRWPVLVMDEEIVWSRQFGVAAKFQATKESRSVVRILYSESKNLELRLVK
jgi:tRNA(Ile)-lysidine synthase